MKVNAVHYTAAKLSPTALEQKGIGKLAPMKYDNKIKMVDIIPISGLIGFGLASVYLIKRGNLDVAMKAIRV